MLLDIDPNVPATIVGDPLRLRQVLVNLAGNAITFTHRGHVLVAVVPDPGGLDGALRFSVTDTGIGIAREHQSVIFEAFSQADGSTTRKFGGTGLGLAICQSLVTLMGGRIWVESEPDRGSTFHFTAVFGTSADLPSRAISAASSACGCWLSMTTASTGPSSNGSCRAGAWRPPP